MRRRAARSHRPRTALLRPAAAAVLLGAPPRDDDSGDLPAHGGGRVVDRPLQRGIGDRQPERGRERVAAHRGVGAGEPLLQEADLPADRRRDDGGPAPVPTPGSPTQRAAALVGPARGGPALARRGRPFSWRRRPWAATVSRVTRKGVSGICQKNLARSAAPRARRARRRGDHPRRPWPYGGPRCRSRTARLAVEGSLNRGHYAVLRTTRSPAPLPWLAAA